MQLLFICVELSFFLIPSSGIIGDFCDFLLAAHTKKEAKCFKAISGRFCLELWVLTLSVGAVGVSPQCYADAVPMKRCPYLAGALRFGGFVRVTRKPKRHSLSWSCLPGIVHVVPSLVSDYTCPRAAFHRRLPVFCVVGPLCGLGVSQKQIS